MTLIYNFFEFFRKLGWQLIFVNLIDKIARRNYTLFLLLVYYFFNFITNTKIWVQEFSK